MNTLKEKRLKKGLTQKQLEKLTGVNSVNVSLIESGKHCATFNTIKKLESVLGNLDFTKKYKIKPTTRRQAGLKIKELMTCLLGLSDAERKQIITRLEKQLNNFK